MNVLPMCNLTQIVDKTFRLDSAQAQRGSVPNQDRFVLHGQRYGHGNLEAAGPKRLQQSERRAPA
jgi:hypothetical protein